jgi:L-lactate dehydrogenase complex protein LldF
LRGWRDRSWREGLEPGSVRLGIGLWAFVAQRPGLYRLATRLSVRMMRLFRRHGWIKTMPLAGGWTAHRDFPAPPGKTFMELHRTRRSEKIS